MPPTFQPVECPGRGMPFSPTGATFLEPGVGAPSVRRAYPGTPGATKTFPGRDAQAHQARIHTRPPGGGKMKVLGFPPESHIRHQTARPGPARERHDRADPQTLRPLAAPGLTFAPGAVLSARSQTAERAPVPASRSGMSVTYLKESQIPGGEGTLCRHGRWLATSVPFPGGNALVLPAGRGRLAPPSSPAGPKRGTNSPPGTFLCFVLRKML